MFFDTFNTRIPIRTNSVTRLLSGPCVTSTVWLTTSVWRFQYTLTRELTTLTRWVSHTLQTQDLHRPGHSLLQDNPLHRYCQEQHTTHVFSVRDNSVLSYHGLHGHHGSIDCHQDNESHPVFKSTFHPLSEVFEHDHRKLTWRGYLQTLLGTLRLYHCIHLVVCDHRWHLHDRSSNFRDHNCLCRPIIPIMSVSDFNNPFEGHGKDQDRVVFLHRREKVGNDLQVLLPTYYWQSKQPNKIHVGSVTLWNKSWSGGTTNTCNILLQKVVQIEMTRGVDRLWVVVTEAY